MQSGPLLQLVKKEFLLEFRQKASLGGILIYIVSTVFVSALCIQKSIPVYVWNALFWIILLFASVTISSKSFLKEARGLGLFNYLYYSPRSFILAKIIFNMALMLVISVITLFFYSWFIPQMIGNFWLFFITLLLSSSGFAGVLSLTSAIAAKANNNFSLMSILSFPVLMPLLLISIRLSKQAIDGLDWSVSTNFLLTLGALNVLVIMLANLLFPYLWND
ncbi:MAG: heme exporter protein CcmB [Bacteroidia bacterium]